MFYKNHWKNLGIVLCLFYMAFVVLYFMLFAKGIELADNQPPIFLTKFNSIGMLIGLFASQAGVVLSGISSVVARIKKTENVARYVLVGLWYLLGIVGALYLLLTAEIILAGM